MFDSNKYIEEKRIYIAGIDKAIASEQEEIARHQQAISFLTNRINQQIGARTEALQTIEKMEKAIGAPEELSLVPPIPE